ncbi:YdcF family protein [Magnetococcales bacterium HHB-1]
MSPALRIFIENFILPPGAIILLILFALAIFNRRPKRSKKVLTLSVFLLYITSIPAMGHFLEGAIETYAPANEEVLKETSAQAIVILGHSRYANAPEYGKDTLNTGGLARARYGAWLYRKTKLPILTSGGRMFGEKTSEAQIMASVLEEEFQVPVYWKEEKSNNTFENAKYTQETFSKIPKENGETVTHILLVTHYRDMPRAIWSFEQAGIKVTPAPTLFPRPKKDLTYLDWIPSPSAGALFVRKAIHEWLGQLWYRIRY